MTSADYTRVESCIECGGAVGVIGYVLGQTHAGEEGTARLAVLLCSQACLLGYAVATTNDGPNEGSPPAEPPAVEPSELSDVATFEVGPSTDPNPPGSFRSVEMEVGEPFAVLESPPIGTWYRGLPSPLRSMVYNLFELSYPVRMRVLATLKLLEPGDDGLEDGELIRRAVRRALDSDRLCELEKAIAGAERPLR